MRNIIRAALTITILAALAIAGRISFATADQTPASASTAPYVVHIKNFAFNPSSLTVPVGATVIFKNEDSAAHTVTASGKNGFDSGNLDNGAQFKYVFTKAGKYDYVCKYHSNMKATIVVSASPPPAASPTPFTPPSPSGY
jgi:plastocyanin